jgi:hypothetical protein
MVEKASICCGKTEEPIRIHSRFLEYGEEIDVNIRRTNAIRVWALLLPYRESRSFGARGLRSTG